MKKYVVLIIALLCFFISCGNDNKGKDTDGIYKDNVSYIVTFDISGVESIKTQTVERGRFAKEPSTPVREGYVFDGWYYNGKIWVFSEETVNSDISLEGRWIPDCLTFVEGKESASVELCSNVNGTVIVPEYYKGKRVVAIYDNAFNGCDKITQVILPDSITTIGACAFEKCTSLRKINIPLSLTKIGNRAFMDCYLLNEVYYGARSLEDLKEYNMVFYDCGVKGAGIKVTVSKNVKRIPSRLFDADCNSSYYDMLEYKNDTRIPKVKTVAFEENGICTEIGRNAFYKLKALTTLTLIDSLEIIGDSAFTYCEGIESVMLPKSICEIGNGAFFNCKALKKVEFPNLTLSSPEIVIGDRAFYDCDSLINVDFKNNIISFGKEVFYYCSSLESVDLGDNVKIIPPRMFYECKSLKTVNLGKEIEMIGEYAFFYCESLESVEFPSTITVIGNSAFSRCKKLEKIIIPNSVTSLGGAVFENCTNLQRVHIGRGVTKLGLSAFSNCYSLEYAFIPKNVDVIEASSFQKCSSLTAVCEAEEKKTGWHENWAKDIKEVKWGQ